MKRHRKQQAGCPQWILDGVRKIREAATTRPAMPEITTPPKSAKEQ